MTKLVRPLALTAALGTAGAFAAHLFGIDPPKPAETPVAVKPAAGDPAPVKYAVDPKPLSDTVKKGLKYLIDNQQPDGGWGQGGGWRTGGGQGGRVDNAADPSDVGNTCIAVLALVRAGNTPTTGEFKENVRKGMKFVCERVEKSDAKDLYVTDVRNTQLQSKIGPYADTFLSALVMAELKGKAGDDDKRLIACLDKTLDKMAKNQKDDGTFAGNGGWAPVLSQGLANKSLARAKQNGVAVRGEMLTRAATQSEASLKGTSAVGGDLAMAGAGRRSGPAERGLVDDAPAATGAVLTAKPSAVVAGAPGLAGGGVGDAGVPLYRISQGAGNLQDVLNGAKLDSENAKKIVADGKATKEQKDEAQKTIANATRLEKATDEARTQVAAQAKNAAFVNGFGSNGGEEFLSFLNISEMLVVKGDKEWTEWDGKMGGMINKAQDKDGSWAGHHCITGKTFCTAGALLVLMADRTPFPEEMIAAARQKGEKKDEKKEEKKEEKK